MKQPEAISISELDGLARQALDALRAVFQGEVNKEALVKADVAIRTLAAVNGRYKAMLKRAALEARIAKAVASRRR